MRPCLRRQTKAVASLQPLGANEMAQAWKGACHLSLVTWVQSPSWFPHLTNMPSSTYRWRDVHKGKTSVPRTPKPTRWQSCAPLGGGQEGGCWLLWFTLNANTATIAARCWFKFLWEHQVEGMYFVTSTVSTNFLGSPASPRVPNSEPRSAHTVISHCFEGH